MASITDNGIFAGQYVSIAISMISEYDTADAMRISERLQWGPERLEAWLAKCQLPLPEGAEKEAMARLGRLCERGVARNRHGYLVERGD